MDHPRRSQILFCGSIQLFCKRLVRASPVTQTLFQHNIWNKKQKNNILGGFWTHQGMFRKYTAAMFVLAYEVRFVACHSCGGTNSVTKIVVGCSKSWWVLMATSPVLCPQVLLASTTWYPPKMATQYERISTRFLPKVVVDNLRVLSVTVPRILFGRRVPREVFRLRKKEGHTRLESTKTQPKNNFKGT
jgi:hypothetical protein